MSRIEVGLKGNGRCRILHADTGAEIRTSMAPEHGGSGGSFSSTDLLAAALGSCIATNLEPVAVRHGISLDNIRISVEKTLDTSPKRIVSLAVRAAVHDDVRPEVLKRLSHAADRCLVHRSLSPDIAVSIRVETDGL